eukprot:TRINITY_DN6108_c0_g3_i1.p1 TRINITY_DN6108_c0_g3~~TRINITY_DN6108_c0_g3_i1.p1  ORF type:complete len:455 (-),score=91.37 TRINITY_DN6108_c0_g3_i1:247-1611(-)
MWADTGINANFVSKMKLYQKVNHFPSMSCLARKNNLGRNLMRMHKYFPKDYNFFPLTWVMPTDYTDFKTSHAQHHTNVYIVKPEAMCQGRGIFLINSPEQIAREDSCVVQQYINDPYLVEGLKFDLRLYVLVYGCDPLRVYVYREGLVRLATEKYERARMGNMENRCMHLTNYAINKRSCNFVFNEDEEKADVGNKRSLEFLWNYVEAQGGNSKLLKRRINRIIVKTLCAAKSQLAHAYKTCQPNDVENNMCFEVLGFDILLDSNLKPWLLEVNHAPSFSVDTPFDYKVKKELIHDTIKLLHMDSGRRARYFKKKEDDFHSKALGKIQLKHTKAKQMELRKRATERRDEYELKNLGGYALIYPDAKMEHKYSGFLQASEEHWQQLYGYTKHISLHATHRDEQALHSSDTSIEPSPKESRKIGNMMLAARKTARPIAKVNLDESLNEPNGKLVMN